MAAPRSSLKDVMLITKQLVVEENKQKDLVETAFNSAFKRMALRLSSCVQVNDQGQLSNVLALFSCRRATLSATIR